MSLPSDIIQLFGTGSVPAIIAATVFFLFSRVESLSSSQLKRSVTTWILRSPDDATSAVEHGKAAWVVLFSSTFDRVFGTELFSWKRVVRSWTISSLVVVVVTLLWGVIRRDQFYALFERTHQDVKGIFTGIVFSAYLFNLIPDYISAIQTQYFVRFVQHRNLGWLATSSVLIGDFVSKTLIFLFFYCLAVMSLFGLLYTFFKDVRDVWDAITFSNISDAVWWFLRYGPALSVEKIGKPSGDNQPVTSPDSTK